MDIEGVMAKTGVQWRQAPFTVIGGFLGAGKTTLINHLLGQAQGVRYAVLVNDFGDLAIDEALIRSHDGQTIALANGCICCTIGNDLVETIMTLMDGKDRPEHLIVEASGVADPRPIAELGSLDPNLTRDLTVVVVDAGQVREQWEDLLLRDTLERQLKAADLLVLNHVSGIDAQSLRALDRWLDEHAHGTAILKSQDGSIAPALLSSATRARPVENQLETAVTRSDHSQMFFTQSLVIDEAMPLDRLKKALANLPNYVLRVKGFVRLDAGLFEVQRAGRRTFIQKSEKPDPKTINTLVLIGSEDLSGMKSLNDILK
jgi:G3E family GTPase